MIPPPPRSTLFPYTTLFRSPKTGNIYPEICITSFSSLYKERASFIYFKNPLERTKSSSSTMIFSNLFSSSVTPRSEEHTSELQSRFDLVCRLLLEKKKSQCLRCSDSSQRCPRQNTRRTRISYQLRSLSHYPGSACFLRLRSHTLCRLRHSYSSLAS